ncbi:MAG TPA: GDL motif peptide-associated radical SAM/SPASM maturase [Solirubrobacteraceae bacterium]|nr:GDL motif peptide-associated radical SAM/SPASM maturase [Solirubrobacteraceae bacterium]
MRVARERQLSAAPEAAVPRPKRFHVDADYAGFVPVHVVWELTLACNLRCSHCGSRAGKRRPDELSTAEALAVVDGLARLGTRELSIIGGEAYLRRDWTEIVARATGHGIRVSMQTGARALTERRLEAGVKAGLQGLGVSLDGLRDYHDRVRGVPGSFDFAVLTLQRAKAAGLKTSVNTQIGPETIAQLPDLLDRIAAAGATHWQLQLTVAMGNAVDNPELILQPHQLLELMPLLAELHHRGRRQGVLMVPGNNIGYFGPYEHLWRGEVGDRGHWGGCAAGQTGIGIEADGTVKGCPSLATVGFAGGNVRDLPLEALWLHARETGGMRPAKEMWGFCGDCYYKEVCRGGCTWTSHSLLGRAGNNPYCHHRVLELHRRGRRERVVKVEDAGPAAFAVGRFALIEEELDGTPCGPPQEAPLDVLRIDPTVGPEDEGNGTGRVPPRLRMCHGCERFVLPEETRCPFCDGDLDELDRERERTSARREALMRQVREEISAP